MVDMPNRVDVRKLPAELQPLWKKLTEVRELVFAEGRVEQFITNGGLFDRTTLKLFRANANKQQVADEWALALIGRKTWASAPAVAHRVQKALKKLEEFGRRIPGVELPIRFVDPLNVFDVGKELAAQAKQRKATKDA